jgi:hypothetical protein
MTKEQALKIIDHALSQISTSRDNHLLFMKALETLSLLCKDKDGD